MEIQIIGSHPDAVLHKSDIAYFINGSIKKSEDVNSDARRYHVVDCRGIKNAINRWRAGNADEHEIDVIHSLEGKHVEKAHFVGGAEIAFVENFLSDIGYTANQRQYWSLENKERFTTRITGIRQPVGIDRLFRFGGAAAFEGSRRLVSALLGRNRKQTLWPAKFRVSNGVFAFLAAIDEFGTQHKYFLSGVGLKPWGYSYKIDGHTIVQQKLRGHLFADLRVLEWAAQFDICTDNESVSDFAGLERCQ